MPLPLIAYAAIAGGSALMSGLSNYFARRDEREQTKLQNKLLEKSAAGVRAKGLSDIIRMNHGASGQLGYLQYKNKLNPQILETFANMYNNRINAGTQLRSEAMGRAAEILGQRKAPTSGKYDFISSLTTGIGAGLGAGMSAYTAFDGTNLNVKSDVTPSQQDYIDIYKNFDLDNYEPPKPKYKPKNWWEK
ncbi:MAG TPA: hypothetical protein PL124_03905 [Candidatus Cloacimonadota bacterium]|nr:hypothetical protein [Candidatus Cloacimonadota bacterium]